MNRAPKMQLPHADWPEEDRTRWAVANKSGADIFDDCGPAAHLAEPSRRALQASYGRFLGFVSTEHFDLLESLPGARVDRQIITDYVRFRRRTCSDSGIAIDLHHFRLAQAISARAPTGRGWRPSPSVSVPMPSADASSRNQ